MRKLFLVAALGVAGLMSAQKIKTIECKPKGCTYVYASTCSTITHFSVVKELTLSAALIIANDINLRDCKVPVKEVTITQKDS